MRIQCHCKRLHALGDLCLNPARFLLVDGLGQGIITLCPECADTTNTYEDEKVVSIVGYSRALRTGTRITTVDLEAIRFWVNAHAHVENFMLKTRRWNGNTGNVWSVVITGDTMPAGLAAVDSTIAGALNKIAQMVAGVNTEELCREEQ